MDMLNKLTIKILKLNKRRTIVTIIGIMLSTALICAVAGMVSSFRYTLLKEAIAGHGDYDVLFENVKTENLTYIENNRQVSNYQVTQNIGYAILEGSRNQDKPYVCVTAFDDKALKNTGLKLVAGRMPENEYELVLSEHISTNAKVAYQIGETLTLEIGRRMLSNDLVIGQEISYSYEEERLEPSFLRTYTVVGVIERPNYKVENYSAPGYTVITAMEETSGMLNVYVNYKQEKKFKEITSDIGKTLTEKQGETFQVHENESVLRWKGLNLSDGNITMIYSIGAIVIVIVIVSSIFVIRNSFAISITERIKQYGMLASIGATSRQIRKNVLFEGMAVGVVSIPLGILLGVLAIVVLIWLMNFIMGEYLNGVRFLYSVPAGTFLISVCLAAITIYFSVLSSARRSAKVSPIDAIRSGKDIKIRAREVRTPKWIKKCFGIGGEIAYKNVKRSRKKYRVTVASLVVSIVIFLAISSLIQFGFQVSGVYYSEMSYNLAVYLRDEENLEGELRTYEEIAELPGVEAYSLTKGSMPFGFQAKEYLTAFGKRINSVNEENDIAYLTVNSVGDEEYRRYVEKLGCSVAECEKGIILVNKSTYYDGKYITDYVYDVKAGDTIIVANEESGMEVEIPIVKVTDIVPMGYENNSGGFLIASDSWLEQLGAVDIYGMYIYSDQVTALEEEVFELVGNTSNLSDIASVSVTNLEESAKSGNAMVLIISIFLYGFITVITLIGVTNIFNTITTNMNLRAKEFAMLKSIGMTTREFNRMTRLESLFYGVKSLCMGIPIGLLLSYFIYRAVRSGMEMQYIVPWIPIVICILFVIIIVGITMRYSIRKINKKNIIETIRNDNS